MRATIAPREPKKGGDVIPRAPRKVAPSGVEKNAGATQTRARHTTRGPNGEIHEEVTANTVTMQTMDNLFYYVNLYCIWFYYLYCIGMLTTLLFYSFHYFSDIIFYTSFWILKFISFKSTYVTSLYV